MRHHDWSKLRAGAKRACRPPADVCLLRMLAMCPKRATLQRLSCCWGRSSHLVHSHDRRAALFEAFRLLRTGGVILAQAFRDGPHCSTALARELMRDGKFAHIVERDLLDGRHVEPDWRVRLFHNRVFPPAEDPRAKSSTPASS